MNNIITTPFRSAIQKSRDPFPFNFIRYIHKVLFVIYKDLDYQWMILQYNSILFILSRICNKEGAAPLEYGFIKY